MRTWLPDLRFAFRMLRCRPGFTAVIVATLALGIGATTVIFSAVNGIYLEPLPYPDPAQLVVVDAGAHYPGRPDISQWGVDYRNFVEWDAEGRVFDGMGAFKRTEPTLMGDEHPERLPGALVTGGFLPMLGVTPTLGRLFATDDERADAPRVVVLGYGLWQRRFGGDPAVLGTSLVLDNTPYVVIGVLPSEFRFPLKIADAEIWTLVLPHDETPQGFSGRNLAAVVRLKPGRTLQHAQSQLDSIARRLEQRYPDRNFMYELKAVGLHERVVGHTRSLLFLLLAAVALVLTIACANVANMVLSRGAARRRELALRAALGAGRARLMRQLLTESVLLGVVGGLLGVWLAYFGTDALVALLPDDIPRQEAIHLDGRVLLFALIVSVFTGLLFGLPSALRAARQDLNTVLKEGSGVAAAVGRHRLQGVFVVGQIAMAMVLLVGAGLLIRSFQRVTSVELGYDPENVLTFGLDIGETTQPQQRPAFVDDVAARLARLPGVKSVGACCAVPMNGGVLSSYRAIDVSESATDLPPFVAVNPVTEDYFTTMRIPVVQGRSFTRLDELGAEGVAVIDQTLARKLWPGENALGKRFTTAFKVKTDHTPEFYRVVGVVGDVHAQGVDARRHPSIYVPYRQHPVQEVNYALRAGSDAPALVPAIRSELAAVTRDHAPYEFSMMADFLANDVAPRRFPMLLLGLFAASALVLAGVGVYGLMSYSVTQRTREFGVRMAIGASERNVLRLVIRRGLKLTAIGVALGVPVGLALARVLSGQLYEIGAADPLTFFGVAILLSGVALFACYIPARRATKVDPMVALRCE